MDWGTRSWRPGEPSAWTALAGTPAGISLYLRQWSGAERSELYLWSRTLPRHAGRADLRSLWGFELGSFGSCKPSRLCDSLSPSCIDQQGVAISASEHYQLLHTVLEHRKCYLLPLLSAKSAPLNCTAARGLPAHWVEAGQVSLNSSVVANFSSLAILTHGCPGFPRRLWL